MWQKNKTITSSDDIFYYIPRRKEKETKKNERNIHIENQKLHFLKKKIGIGSSTFDYMNDINKDKYTFPKIKPSFLSKNVRNKIVLNNIEQNNMLKERTINPLYKLRLSNSCELFHKLTKTFMSDKNCLKEINNKEILFNDNNLYDNDNNNNESNLNSEMNKNSVQNKNFLTINKSKSISKFNNLVIKKSLSRDGKNFKRKNQNENDNNNIFDDTRNKIKIDNYNATTIDNNKTNTKYNLKGMNKYYINFLYNKIFPKFFFENSVKYNVVDNKLNIFYAENDTQFKENLIKKNRMLRAKGKPIKKMCINTLYVSEKLKDVKKKIGFLKGVTDYSYPGIILQKVKAKNRLYELNKKKQKKFVLPYEEIERADDEINKLRNQILSKTIIIENKNNMNKII